MGERCGRHRGGRPRPCQSLNRVERFIHIPGAHIASLVLNLPCSNSLIAGLELRLTGSLSAPGQAGWIVPHTILAHPRQAEIKRQEEIN